MLVWGVVGLSGFWLFFFVCLLFFFLERFGDFWLAEVRILWLKRVSTCGSVETLQYFMIRFLICLCILLSFCAIFLCFHAP